MTKQHCETDSARKSSNKYDDASGDSSSNKRKLILGTLAAIGAIHLTGWELQAHGNRSSHSPQMCDTAAMAFGPNDYVVMRQAQIAPDATETQPLIEIKQQMEQMLKADAEAASTPEYQRLAERHAEAEATLRLRPISREVLDLLKKGDALAAVTIIEGQGDADRVLANYNWVMLDILQFDRKGLSITPEQAELIAPIARAAVAYAERTLDRVDQTPAAPNRLGLMIRGSEVLFNAASFMVPDTGEIAPEIGALALKASQRALEINQNLKMEKETMYATWKVGFVAMRTGDSKTAQDHFEQAAAMSRQLDSPGGEAWAKIYLARTIAEQNPTRAAQLEREGWQLAQTLRNEGDVEIEFLYLTAAE